MEEQIGTTPIKVIVCDDHTLFRQGIKSALAFNKDIKIEAEVENGEALLNALQHIRPNVILLDINMPIMDGMETLPIIKDLYPDIKVIIISMHNQPSMISKMIALGASAYLTKGDSAETIYEAIRTVNRGMPYFTPLVSKALFKVTQESQELKNKDVKVYSNYDYEEWESPKNVVSMQSNSMNDTTMYPQPNSTSRTWTPPSEDKEIFSLSTIKGPQKG
jgi:DNA-binding NarL/FixJ family response regulator